MLNVNIFDDGFWQTMNWQCNSATIRPTCENKSCNKVNISVVRCQQFRTFRTPVRLCCVKFMFPSRFGLMLKMMQWPTALWKLPLLLLDLQLVPATSTPPSTNKIKRLSYLLKATCRLLHDCLIHYVDVKTCSYIKMDFNSWSC